MKKQTAKKVTKKAVKKAAKPRQRSVDPNQFAFDLVRRTTEALDASAPAGPSELDISRVMAEMGRRGGKIGGKKRAQALSPEKRSEIALKAARSRWDKTARV